jgi:putative membrane protein
MSRSASVQFALAGTAGLLLMTALIVHQGFSGILAALTTAGWRLFLVPLFHLVPLFFYGLAWQVVLVGTWSGRLGVFQWASWFREAGNTLLPVPQVGGEFLAARLLTFAGAAPGLAVGSIVVDLTLVAVSQFALTIFGIALLVGSGHFEGPVRGLVLGLVLFLPLLLGFFLAQRWGLFGYLERGLEQVAAKRPEWGLGSLAGMHDAIQELYRKRQTIILSSVLHLLAWLLSSVEVWIALTLMGYPVSLQQAVVIYSLGTAVRSAAVLIPSGLGAQEASFMFLAGMYGFPASVGLAVSLAIRFREITLGGPALLLWPLLEGRRAFSRRRAPVPPSSAPK